LQFPEQQSAFTTQGRLVYELGFVTQAQVPFAQLWLEQSASDWQWAPTGATQAGVRPVDCEYSKPQISELQQSALPRQVPR
jgi:hypothetical protein